MKGFTLVELLISVFLITFIALVAVATLGGGFHVWDRLQAFETQDQWVQLAFHQFRRDVRNVGRFEPIPFEGQYDELSFAQVLASQEAAPEEIGRIGYFFDAARHQLCRGQTPYRCLGRESLRDSCQPLLEGIDRVRFSFYGRDSQAEGVHWTDSWNSAKPPLAVKMEIRYVPSAQREPRERSLLVSIPTA